jgi:hypothetical protein
MPISRMVTDAVGNSDNEVPSGGSVTVVNVGDGEDEVINGPLVAVAGIELEVGTSEVTLSGERVVVTAVGSDIIFVGPMVPSDIKVGLMVPSKALGLDVSEGAGTEDDTVGVGGEVS